MLVHSAELIEWKEKEASFLPASEHETRSELASKFRWQDEATFFIQTWFVGAQEQAGDAAKQLLHSLHPPLAPSTSTLLHFSPLFCEFTQFSPDLLEKTQVKALNESGGIFAVSNLISQWASHPTWQLKNETAFQGMRIDPTFACSTSRHLRVEQSGEACAARCGRTEICAEGVEESYRSSLGGDTSTNSTCPEPRWGVFVPGAQRLAVHPQKKRPIG
jgi:hypothetical protein